MFCNFKNLFLLVLTLKHYVLLLLFFRIFHNLKYISHRSWKEGRGSGFWWRVGNGGTQAGKGSISLSHIEIKEHAAIQTVYIPCQLCSSPPTRVTMGGFFIEAKEYFSHAVAPLTSYKRSKLHRYMKTVLCKLFT